MYLLRLIFIIIICVIRLLGYVGSLEVLSGGILEGGVLLGGGVGDGGVRFRCFLSTGVRVRGCLVLVLVFSCFVLIIPTYFSSSLTPIIPFAKIISVPEKISSCHASSNTSHPSPNHHKSSTDSSHHHTSSHSPSQHQQHEDSLPHNYQY